MQMYDFVGQVRSDARLASLEQALAATRATLETLAERLGADDSRRLAAQLPEGIGQYLDGRDAVAEDFPPDEFLRRISAREGVKAGDADYHARAVLGTLRQAVPWIHAGANSPAWASPPASSVKTIAQAPSDDGQVSE